jgi:hypothetical protein
VVENTAEKFDFLGTGPIIRAIIKDEHRLTLITCQPVEDAVKISPESQQKPSPIIGAGFEQVVCRIFPDFGIIVDDNTPEEILPDEWQCEDDFYQRTDAVSVAFANLS